MHDERTWRIQLFYKIFALKIINYQFLSYDIESASKTCIYWISILKQLLSCSITIYIYLIFVKMTKHLGTNQLFPLLNYMVSIS